MPSSCNGRYSGEGHFLDSLERDTALFHSCAILIIQHVNSLRVPSCLLPVNPVMMVIMRSLVSNKCYRSKTEFSNNHKLPTGRRDDFNHFPRGPDFARGGRLRRSTCFVELEPLSPFAILHGQRISAVKEAKPTKSRLTAMRSCTCRLGSCQLQRTGRWALEGQARGQARGRAHGQVHETYKRACAGSRTSRPNRAHICLNDGFDVINYGQSNPGRERLGSVVMGRRCRDRLQLRFPPSARARMGGLGLEFVPS